MPGDSCTDAVCTPSAHPAYDFGNNLHNTGIISKLAVDKMERSTNLTSGTVNKTHSLLQEHIVVSEDVHTIYLYNT